MDRFDCMLERCACPRPGRDLLPRLGASRWSSWWSATSSPAGEIHHRQGAARRPISTVLSDRAGIDGFLRDGGRARRHHRDPRLLWLLDRDLAALVIGFNGLGLNYITDLLVKCCCRAEGDRRGGDPRLRRLLRPLHGPCALRLRERRCSSGRRAARRLAQYGRCH